MSRVGILVRGSRPIRRKQPVFIPRASFVTCLLLVALTTLQIETTFSTRPHENLARVRRQTSGQNALGSNQTPGADAAGNQKQGDSSNNNDPNSDGAERQPEEVLASLKCDFGSSEAPDLCKFKILESDNPLARGLAVWSLGSGKLALFQGGPLIDASQGNDTFGGYIFYETSNPFAGQQAASNSMQLGAANASHHHNQPEPANYNQQQDYSTVLTALVSGQRGQSQRHGATNSMLTHRHNEPGETSHQQFQQVSSSRLSIGANSPGPSFLSPNLTAPGPSGMCLSFYYAIQGLSAEELRIHVQDQKTGRSRQIWASSESAAGNWTRAEVLYSVTNQHQLMFSAATSGTGQSSSSSSLATSAKELQQRKFRGHLALDEIEINRHDPNGGDAPCKGHCNFDGDLCGWTNAENGLEDNFDWTFGRGSDNLFTGPARDFTSSGNNELTGSYLFTDAGYPRRPGDRALLVSPMFQPTAVNEAMCMRLAVHMFGSGIGSLAIKIRYADDDGGGGGSSNVPGANPAAAAATPAGGGGAASSPPSGVAGGSAAPAASNTQGAANANQPFAPNAGSNARSDSRTPSNELVIWEMSGDAGNSWHLAQTSVSSSRSPFQVLIEGVVGENHLGNMAIDEISFSPGPCPTSPPVASKNYGDCTFEQSMCYWRNPDADIHLDDLDWIRTADEQSIHGPNFDHTTKRRSGSYMKLENTLREPKSGSRAFLLSPIFQPKASGSVQCLSFYYYMFIRSISSSGPNLGTIRVYLASNNDLVPIWRLTNPISSPSWKHARASLSTAIIDGQPQAPTKLFQIAFEGIWGDAVSGAIALDDITVFDGACDIMPPEAKSVPGECTFDVDLCTWSNKTYELMPTEGQPSDASDTSRSPFLQSVNSFGGGSGNFHQTNNRLTMTNPKRAIGWQLATVDSRPVNLQDHTYKAPIGYTFVDVFDNANQQMALPLQSHEVAVQSGQQVALCLSFWFAVFGRQDTNQLQVYLTQASAPPQPPEDIGGQPQPGSPGPQSTGGSSANNRSPNSNNGLGGSPGGSSADEGEGSTAWKSINGKLLWSVTSKNVTEASRRKWLYGQVTVKADSNYIVRFVALSKDGGFALDDISFFDGVCETRPAHARTQSAEDEAAELQAAQQPLPSPATPGKATS